MKIYKYSPIDTAILIIKGGRVKLNHPSVFNDPFDTDIKNDPEDAAKTEQIMVTSSYIAKLIGLINDPNVANSLKFNPSFAQIKEEYQRIIDKLKLTHRLDETIDFTKYKEWLAIDTTNLKQIAINESKQALTNIKNGVKETNKSILVSCFSKDPKSILMWSHYAENHTGLCIEYERPESPDFVDMKYSEYRPRIKTSKLTSFLAAKTILVEDYNQNFDQSIIDELMTPYQTKAKEWEYEQEVRCMITSKSKSLIKDGDDFYYKMPKPTKIIIGCRASGKELNELIKIAKKMSIRYTFLKKENETFLLKEKHK